MKGRLSSYTDEEFIAVVKTSDSLSDLKKKLGYITSSGGIATLIKKRVIRLNIDTSHFTRSREVRMSNIGKSKYTLEDILIKDSTYDHRRTLKNRLVSNGLLEYKCEACNNEGIWQGKSMTLQIDHKNGICNDNRIENLRFLCPNCHSQTSTFSGRNKGSAAQDGGLTPVCKTGTLETQ